MSILSHVAPCHAAVIAEQRAPQSPVIYLSASKTTFGTDQYHHVLHYIVRGFPGATILDATSLWTSADHWRAEYQVVLSPVTHLFILPNDRDYVGRGSYAEWEFLTPTVTFCGGFVHDDAFWTPIDLVVIDPWDWVNFAAIRHLATGEPSVPGVDYGA
jgi:hypothetical protein